MSNKFRVTKIRAANGRTVGRIDIYGIIESTKVKGGERELTPNHVLEQLNGLGGVSELELHIFSEGGSVDAGMSIYSILRQRPEMITAYVEGIAASIATIIMCAADKIYISDNGRLLIHKPAIDGHVYLREKEARELAEEMAQIALIMARIYAKRTGKTETEMLALMEGESGSGTWFTAEQAIEYGLADGYIPDAKRPSEPVACIGPAMFGWKGCKIDLSAYPDAIKMTADIGKNKKRGVQKNMAKFLFGNKKRKARGRRAEAELIDMVCPHCSAEVLLNPETAEVALAGDEGEAEAEVSETVARRMRGNMRAEIYTVTCPSCGEEFVWDTDVNADGAEASEAIETAEMDASEAAEVLAKRQRLKKTKARAKARKRSRIRSEILEAACPSCAAFIGFDTDSAAVITDENGMQCYSIVCGECGTEVLVPIVEAEAPVIAARARVRKRAEIAETVCPNCAAPVAYDTESVSSGTDENGITGYSLVCPECGTEFTEPTETLIPDAIPVDTPAIVAYKMGVKAERSRMLALDEMLNAAPYMESMLTAAKKSGASAHVMSRNVFKAMASNPTAKGAQHLQAVKRDADSGGINTLGNVRHYNKLTAFSETVAKRLEDR